MEQVVEARDWFVENYALYPEQASDAQGEKRQ
jgi:hypothetical protein